MPLMTTMMRTTKLCCAVADDAYPSCTMTLVFVVVGLVAVPVSVAGTLKPQIAAAWVIQGLERYKLHHDMTEP